MNYSLYKTAYLTIARKEIIRILRIWTQTFLPPIITTMLYFIIFGSLIGSQVRKVDGFAYMQFITPGLIMMTVITNSFSNVASSFFTNKYQRSIEEMLVAPVPSLVLVLGFISGGVFRGLGIGLIVTTLASFFAHLSIHNYILMISVVLLSSILFSLLGLINGIYARKFDDVMIVPTFILTPLTYLGGVFYSVNLLPSFWQHLSKFNPILYMVNAFRDGMLGISDVNIYVAFSFILGITLSALATAWYLLAQGRGIRT